MSNQRRLRKQLKPVAQEVKVSKSEGFLWVVLFGFAVVGMITSIALLYTL